MSQEPHPPGTICWAELSTSDSEGAKRFYTGLFDWQVKEDPQGGTVSILEPADGGQS